MHVVLTELDRLLEDLTEVSQVHDMPCEITFSKWMEKLTSPQQIKEALLAQVFQYNETPALQLYLRNIQMILTRLMDACDALIDVMAKKLYTPASLITLLNTLQNNLDSVFKYLRDNFYSYFNKAQLMPVRLQRIDAVELKEQIEIIACHFNTLTLDTALVQIAFQPLYGYVNGEYRISFKTLDYYKEYLTDIQSLLHSIQHTDMTTGFSEFLIKRNFNDAAFIQYYIQNILYLNELDETIQERLDKYAAYLKKVNQWNVHITIALHPNLKSAQWQIQNWLEEEIFYLKKILAEQVAAAAIHPVNPMKLDTKINLSISVAVLAFLLKLLLSAGIIINKNQSDVLRFFAAYFRTARQENIAYKSLHNQFDSPRLGTFNIAKEILKKLLQLVDKI
jgi:hypothetical protein